MKIKKLTWIPSILMHVFLSVLIWHIIIVYLKNQCSVISHGFDALLYLALIIV